MLDDAAGNATAAMAAGRAHAAVAPSGKHGSTGLSRRRAALGKRRCRAGEMRTGKGHRERKVRRGGREAAPRWPENQNRKGARLAAQLAALRPSGSSHSPTSRVHFRGRWACPAGKCGVAPGALAEAFCALIGGRGGQAGRARASCRGRRLGLRWEPVGACCGAAAQGSAKLWQAPASLGGRCQGEQLRAEAVWRALGWVMWFVILSCCSRHGPIVRGKSSGPLDKFFPSSSSAG